ncbi:MAG TPA: branched-chain amino acid ABC transporter permease [Acidimicrobiia bacterium]|nr:branched-chain amino acid ABC transporter permease [Acidimicrobiia bacterium]
MNSFLQLAALGVAQGSFLLIASLGFSLTRRVEGFLNIAHAQYLSVSAFVTFFLNNSMGIHFVVAALAGVLAAVAVGFLFGKVVYEPIRRLGPAVLLITSVGVVYMLEGIIEAVIGTGSFLVTLPRIAPVRFGPIAITFYQVMVVAVAILVTAGTAWFLQRTRIGTAIRITSLDRNLGASRGVDVRQAANASWVLSSALAGVGGVALAVLGALTTTKGFEQILIILAVALLAGVGSIWSLVVSALAIGVAREVSLLWIGAGFRDIIAFGIVILVLIFMPNGISGRTE